MDADRIIRNRRGEFWGLVDKTPGQGPKGECWEWQARKTSKGYGACRFMGREARAHRVAWEITNGLIPDGLFVCHTCDNPPCVNLAHLFLGTNLDNMRDAVQKGRFRSGAGNRRPMGSKLTADDIGPIRELHKSGAGYRVIARRYGVGRTSIQDIIRGKTWKHLIKRGAWEKPGRASEGLASG